MSRPAALSPSSISTPHRAPHVAVAAVLVILGAACAAQGEAPAPAEYHAGEVVDYYCQPETGLVDKQRCTFIVDFGCWSEYRTEWGMTADTEAAVAAIENHYAELQSGRVTACTGSWGEQMRAQCECLVAQMHTCQRVQIDALDECGFRE